MAPDRPRENQHRIARMRFDMRGSEERALLDFRARLAEAAETELPAALEAVLDQTAGPDEVVEIARLEVDLGVLDPTSANVEAIAAATATALARRIAPRSRFPATTATAMAAGNPTKEGDNDRVTRRSRSSAALAAYLIYLQTGRLSPSSPSRRIDEILEALVDDPTAASRVIALIQHIAASGGRHAALRLIATVAPELVVTWLGAVRPKALVALDGRDGLIERLKAARVAEDVITAEAHNFLTALGVSKSGMAPAETANSATPEAAVAAGKTKDAALGIPAPNAGVVLLHPFFPALFNRCGLMEGHGFRDASAQITAAHLLGHVATGGPAGDEAELTAARALCALAPETPSPPLGPVDPAHAAEAGNLLRSAIGHWTKLGSASPAGLREAFLTRPGILFEGGPAMRLAVEQRGVDVLLDHLPWALTPVHLPWLDKLIKVDWR